MQAQTISTNWNLVTAAAAIACLPIAGKFADLYGRRIIFIVVVMCAGAAFWVFTVDGLFDLGDAPILLTGVGIGAFQCLGPVQWAMAIDLVPDPVDQARFFPVMAAITNGSVSSIVGEALAYLCLALYLGASPMLSRLQ
jgi:MFS family permease